MHTVVVLLALPVIYQALKIFVLLTSIFCSFKSKNQFLQHIFSSKPFTSLESHRVSKSYLPGFPQGACQSSQFLVIAVWL